MEYRLLDGESPIEFQCRVSRDKGLIGTWQDVADICNRELGWEYTESKYRKDWNSLYRMFEMEKAAQTTQKCSAVNENPDDEKSAAERLRRIEEKTQELKKQTQWFYDQRREFNKITTHEARAEYLENCLVNAAKGLQEICPMVKKEETADLQNAQEDTEAVVYFSDWHYGMVTENVFNKYNTEICKRRVNYFVDRVIERLRLHKPNTLHVVLLGDAAHGGIHVTTRVQAEETVCEQLMHVSELIAESIYKLSLNVNKTKVYSTYGNHMRTIQNKKDNVHADNMERIVGWWLKERFAAVDNIDVIDSEFEDMIVLPVCGCNILCVHGDLDNVRQIGPTFNTLFSKRYGETIDYTVSADKHHIEELEHLGIENTIVPSLCGTDEYANGKRLYSNPGQTLMTFRTGLGKDATYHIRLP